MRTHVALTLSALLLLATPAAGGTQIVDDAHRQRAMQHYRTGQDFLYAEQFEKAEQEFSTAIQLDPLLTLAHYGRGQALMALKRYASAVQAFIKCREAFQQVFALRQSDVVALDRRADQEIRELTDTIAALQSGRVKSMGGTASTVDARVA